MPSKKGRRLKQPTKEERQDRLAELEQYMIQRVSTPMIERELSRRWGCSTRTVRRYIREIRDKWNEEAQEDTTPEARNLRRAKMRKSLEHVASEALNKTEIVRDSDGSVVLDAHGQPMVRPKPQLHVALRALKQLCELDALALPKELVLRHSTAAPAQDGKFQAHDAETLRAFLIRGRQPANAKATPLQLASGDKGA